VISYLRSNNGQRSGRIKQSKFQIDDKILKPLSALATEFVDVKPSQVIRWVADPDMVAVIQLFKFAASG
jgi:hypothetical protein